MDQTQSRVVSLLNKLAILQLLIWQCNLMKKVLASLALAKSSRLNVLQR